MNVLRCLLGTRRKQLYFAVLFCISVSMGLVYWHASVWGFGETKTFSKPRNASELLKLRSYLLRVRQRPVEPTKTPRLRTQGNPTTLPERTDFAWETQQRQETNLTTLKTLVTQQRTKLQSQTGYRNLATKPKPSESGITEKMDVSHKVHIFYYPWYGNPSFDRRYLHWNHQYLPHWNPLVAQRFKKGAHRPPEDIGSNFYPDLGCYSSSDPKVMQEHMRQIRTSGAGVVVVSWYPPDKADHQGIPVDKLVPELLDVAETFKLKVTLHIEPYKGRNDKTVRDDIVYITEKYARHPAFYKYKSKRKKPLPLLYVYDSYHTPAEEWSNLLKQDGSHTIRNTPHDCVIIALMVDQSHRNFITVGGFDGFYTYFAVNGFTYGSRWDSWLNLKSFADQTDSIFIPSVGPGYIDTNVRPWNSENTRSREGGRYYKQAFERALSVKPSLVSITSFNEWHEGTQIEKAIPKPGSSFKYLDYLPHQPDYYLKLTRKYVDIFGAVRR